MKLPRTHPARKAYREAYEEEESQALIILKKYETISHKVNLL